MTKWQEEGLLRDIHEAVKIFERFVSALEKKDGGEKTEVIKCKDCKYWRNRRRLFAQMQMRISFVDLRRGSSDDQRRSD